MVARRLTGWQPQKRQDGVWIYPPLEDVMSEAGLQGVETYVSGRQNTVAQYFQDNSIATKPLPRDDGLVARLLS